MPNPERVEVAGARLERWDARRDLGALMVMAEDPVVVRFLNLPAETLGLVAISAMFEGHWHDHGFGLWSVRLPRGGPAGWVGACHPKWHPEYAGQVELAWAFTGLARGKGIATTGAAAAADACFGALGLAEVIAFIDPANAASQAVAGRLGMRLTGATIDPRKGTPLEVHTLRPSAA